MQAEREELVKFTFPELRKRCRERGVVFVDVDLRWGVTDEQKAEGKVLPICLAEIERCRPYFIGILGERYGWVSEEIDPALAEEQEWLKEHREKSVTELEILHGVLNDSQMKKLAFFYFRDLNTSERVEQELSKATDYLSEPQEVKEKLQSLKEKIRQGGFPIKENYADAKTLGQLILDDLWEIIDKKFPQEEVPSALESERMDHQAFASARTKVYIAREEYFKRLDEHIKSKSLPLVLTGESGCGKSALIANWVKGYKERHPDDFIVMHFIGSSAESTNHISILRRIMVEIDERTGIKRYTKDKDLDSTSAIGSGEEGIPSDPQNIIEQFPIWLTKASAKGRFILILDGLNQVEDRDNAQELGWLPTYFPPNVKVILSSLPGSSLEALKKRGLPTLQVENLSVKERKKFITEYLVQYTKKLESSQAKRIAAADQTSSPLYLRALLEELRIYGDHHTLQQRTEHYLKAKTTDKLYERILERWEEDYERERPGLVRDVLSLFWASRRGLTETEILELLSSNGKPLPKAYWSPFYLAIEESLVNRSGIFNFFHYYIRQAVEGRYLPYKRQQQKQHLFIADFFEKLELSNRKVDELPWQLLAARQWERLKDAITNLDLFNHLNTDLKKYELIGYWLALGKRYDMVEAYGQVLNEYELKTSDQPLLANFLNLVAGFLSLNARYAGAEPLNRRALAILEKALGPWHLDTASCLYNLAGLLRDTGAYEEAETLFRRTLAINEKVQGTWHPETASCLNNLAELLTEKKDDYEEAERLFRRSLAIHEKTKGIKHPDTASVLNNLGMLLCNKNAYEEAESILRQSLTITEQTLGTDHLDTATTLHNLAALLEGKGAYEEAELLIRRSLTITEQILGPDHPFTARSKATLASLQRYMGNFNESETLYNQVIRIREKIYGPNHPLVASSLLNLADLLREKGDYDSAESLLIRSLEIKEKVFGSEHREVAFVLNILGLVYFDMGDFVKAEPILNRALKIREKVLGSEHPETLPSLNNFAGLLREKGDYEGAESLYRQTLEIKRKIFGPENPSTAIGMKNLADILIIKGDYINAESLLKKTLFIEEKALGSNHLERADSLDILAGLYRKKGDYDSAEPLYKQVLEIKEKILGSEHIKTVKSINDLALLLYNKCNYEEAIPLFKRAIEIYENVLGPEHAYTAISLNNLARLLKDKGDFTNAESLYRRALEIREKVLDSNHSQISEILYNLAQLYTIQGEHNKAMPLYQRLFKIYKNNASQKIPETPEIISQKAICSNELAFHKHVPSKNWKEAEWHYKQAIKLQNQLSNPKESANSQLNLQTMYSISRQKVDLEKVKEATEILEETGDKRAEKGYKLLSKK
jgi:tetratricopeptide (TPR) repeat protein